LIQLSTEFENQPKYIFMLAFFTFHAVILIITFPIAVHKREVSVINNIPFNWSNINKCVPVRTFRRLEMIVSNG